MRCKTCIVFALLSQQSCLPHSLLAVVNFNLFEVGDGRNSALALHCCHSRGLYTGGCQQPQCVPALVMSVTIFCCFLQQRLFPVTCDFFCVFCIAFTQFVEIKLLYLVLSWLFCTFCLRVMVLFVNVPYVLVLLLHCITQVFATQCERTN